MARGRSVGTAYLSIVASTKGLAKDVKSALAGAGVTSGKQLGQTITRATRVVAPAVQTALVHGGEIAAPQIASAVPRAVERADWGGAWRTAADGADRALIPRITRGLKVVGKVGGALLGVGLALEAKQALEAGFSRAKTLETAGLRLKALKIPDAERASILDSAKRSVKGTAFGAPDAAALAGGLSAAGVKGAELDRVLNTVVDTAAVAGRDLSSVGLIFSSVFARGKLQGDDLMQLLSAGIPVTQLLAKSLGKTSAEVSGLVSSGRVTPAQLIAALETGFAGAGKVMAQGYEGATANLEAAKARLGQSLLEPLLPHLTAGAERLTGLIDSLQPSIAWLGGALAGAWGWGLDAAAAAGRGIIAALSAVWEAGKAGWQLLSDGVTAAQPAWEAFRGTVAGVWEVIGKPVWDVASVVIPQYALAGWEALKTAASALWGTAKGLAAPLADAAAAAGSTVWGVLAGVWEQLGGLWRVVSPILAAVGQALWDAVRAIGAGAWSTITGLWDGITAALQGLIEGIQAGWPGLQTLFQGISDLLSALWPILEPLATLVGGVLYIALVGVSTALGGILQLLGPLLSFAGQLLGGVFSVIGAGAGALSGVIGRLAGIFGTVLAGAWRIVSSVYDTVLKPVWDAISSAWTSIVKPATDAIAGAFDGVQKAWSGLKDLVDKALRFGGDLIDGMIEGVKGAAKRMWKAVTDAVMGPINWVKDKLGIRSPSRYMMALGGYTGEGFAIGYERTAGLIQRASARLAEAAYIDVAPPPAAPTPLASALVAAPAGSAGAAGPVINIDQMVIREDADVHRLARELADLWETRARGRGL